MRRHDLQYLHVTVEYHNEPSGALRHFGPGISRYSHQNWYCSESHKNGFPPNLRGGQDVLYCKYAGTVCWVTLYKELVLIQGPIHALFPALQPLRQARFSLSGHATMVFNPPKVCCCIYDMCDTLEYSRNWTSNRHKMLQSFMLGGDERYYCRFEWRKKRCWRMLMWGWSASMQGIWRETKSDCRGRVER